MANQRPDPSPTVVLVSVSVPDATARLRRALAIILEAAAQDEAGALPTAPQPTTPERRSSDEGAPS